MGPQHKDKFGCSFEIKLENSEYLPTQPKEIDQEGLQISCRTVCTWLKKIKTLYKQSLATCNFVGCMCLYPICQCSLWLVEVIAGWCSCSTDRVLFAMLHGSDNSVFVPGLLSCCVQTPAAPSGLEPLADPLLSPVTAGAPPCSPAILISASFRGEAAMHRLCLMPGIFYHNS